MRRVASGDSVRWRVAVVHARRDAEADPSRCARDLREGSGKEDIMQKKPVFAAKPPIRPEPVRAPMTPLAQEQLRHVAGGPIGNPTS
jgi:hypothetical protein